MTETLDELRLETPRFEDGAPLLIAGLRGHFTDANWHEIPAQWQRLAAYGSIPAPAGRIHYGLCFNLSNGIDYLCGVEVSTAANLAAEFTSVSIPAQRYVVFPYHDHVSKLHQLLDTIGRKWFPSSGYEAAQPAAGAPNFFERYGKGFDPHTGKGDIEVWIPIKGMKNE